MYVDSFLHSWAAKAVVTQPITAYSWSVSPACRHCRTVCAFWTDADETHESSYPTYVPHS